MPRSQQTEALADDRGTTRGSIPSTRTSVSWTFVAVGIVALIVILVFILENLQTTDAAFFGVHWRIPLGLDLLFAALLGALAVFLVGAARVIQLRILARRRGTEVRRRQRAEERRQEPAATAPEDDSAQETVR